MQPLNFCQGLCQAPQISPATPAPMTLGWLPPIRCGAERSARTNRRVASFSGALSSLCGVSSRHFTDMAAAASSFGLNSPLPKAKARARAMGGGGGGARSLLEELQRPALTCHAQGSAPTTTDEEEADNEEDDDDEELSLVSAAQT